MPLLGWRSTADRVAPLLTAILFSIAGCRGAAEPEARGQILNDARTERFVLRTIDGHALPAVAVDNGYTVLTVIADTIWLGPDGTGLRSTLEHSASDIVIPPGARTYHHASQFTYRMTSGRLEIDFECSDVASCVAPPHFVGTRHAERLTVTAALYYRTPMVYERIRD